METYREGWQDFTRLFVGTYNVVCRVVSRKRLRKHIPAATDMQATTEVLLEMVSSTWSVQKGYKENN